MSRVGVIGAGAWGTTLAILLAENKHNITLWAFEKELVPEMRERRENCRFLPGFPLPAATEITDQTTFIESSEIIFVVVPTQFLRSTIKRFSSSISSSAIVVSACKGIEEKTLQLPSEIIKEEIGCKMICALSGPNLSSEIARGLPAATTVASTDEAAAKKVQSVLMVDRFRVYTNKDMVGVQLGGALKNVIAIAAGIVDGLNLGDNAKAGLLVRGLAEISRLGVAMGGRPETFAGLSGVGDLITTCSSKLSRNHQVGIALANGKKLTEILSQMNDVAEGVPTTVAARELGKKHKVRMPITDEVYSVLYENKEPYQAINALMTRSATSE